MAAVSIVWRCRVEIVARLSSISQAFPEVKGIDQLGGIAARVQLGLGVRLTLSALLGMDPSHVAIGVAGEPDLHTDLARVPCPWLTSEALEAFKPAKDTAGRAADIVRPLQVFEAVVIRQAVVGASEHFIVEMVAVGYFAALGTVSLLACHRSCSSLGFPTRQEINNRC